MDLIRHITVCKKPWALQGFESSTPGGNPLASDCKALLTGRHGQSTSDGNDIKCPDPLQLLHPQEAEKNLVYNFKVINSLLDKKVFFLREEAKIDGKEKRNNCYF